MQKKGKLSEEVTLPTTVEEGIDTFAGYEIKPIPPQKQMDGKGEVVVSFENVRVSYRAVKGEALQIFDDFNMEIRHGEKIALIGSNGAGKSTMMKLMIGLLKASEGDVKLCGMSTKKMSPEEMARMISMVYQNPEEMFIKDSIEADIAYAMKVRNVADWEKRTQDLLKMFNLENIKERDGRLLSGGQMRRASLAIGIALNPGILLLDEPTANLDIATRHEIMRTLEELKEVTETVMIATHDMQLVCQWAERIIVLCKGKIIADGTRDEIFSNEEVISKVGIQPPEIYKVARGISENVNCYTIEDFVENIGERSEGCVCEAV